MGEPFSRARRKVMVAVGFDDRTEALLDAGESLARALGAPLRLVHVLDPMASLSRSILATGMEAGPFALVNAMKKEARSIATQRLTRLVETLPSDVEAESAVIDGDLPRALAREAASQRVGAVLVGARRGAAGGLGMSTAVSLILECEAPVIVMNEEAQFRPRSRGPTFVVADDFCDESATALSAAFNLACRWPGAHLVHTHVESFSNLTEGLKDGDEESLKARVGEARMAAEDAMAMRAGSRVATLAAAGGRYARELVTGGVICGEIERAAFAARADMLIFGQHRAVHHHPAHPGQVPFKLMLAVPKPVMVVPLQGG